MLMNSADRPAMLFYQPNGFRVLSPGSHVICAVSSEPVPLESLRYWCVERQEAYASAEFATRRLTDQV
ncbi:DUF2093 domain-containing protein [Novosphingobium sp.]|uniref:DUF2093 domain-containing protein n=1 Tax=Novosphingobium sp. TaxID=1874826 RepID=UPI0025E46EE8|nr:DUF2093 domain-containing protein [Novosphingobium sp.]MCC6927221.1 DUF2093 domain-containing protein [Novosphingobium sp.]